MSKYNEFNLYTLSVWKCFIDTSNQ